MSNTLASPSLVKTKPIHAWDKDGYISQFVDLTFLSPVLYLHVFFLSYCVLLQPTLTEITQLEIGYGC